MDKDGFSGLNTIFPPLKILSPRISALLGKNRGTIILIRFGESSNELLIRPGTLGERVCRYPSVWRIRAGRLVLPKICMREKRSGVALGCGSHGSPVAPDL